MEQRFFIKDQLARHGVTQAKVAERLGCSRQNLSQRLSRGALSFEELEKIANICGCHFVPRFEPIDRELH